jgi:hypothetical protein
MVHNLVFGLGSSHGTLGLVSVRIGHYDGL